MNRFSEDNTSIGLANPPSTNDTNGDAPDTPHPCPSPPRGEGSCGERDDKGRFARGNRGGPGNPFARQTAALRRALVNAATEQDIQQVSQRIIAQAKDGDMAAAKLLFAYVIGKPADAVDPDTLDVQEWQMQREHAIAPKDLSVLMNGVPAETVVPVMREVVPCLGRKFADTLLGQMADRGWPEAMPYVRRSEAPSAPSTNPSNRPSTNRSNGGGKKRRHRKGAALKDPRPATKP